METQTRVLASHLLSKVEPIKGTLDVTADAEAKQEIDRLVDYLLAGGTTPYRTSGSTATVTDTYTDTGASNTNTIPDADSDNESDFDSDHD
ncbi:hypothetical protein FHS29_005054 [Saccharothrix tamanrassetensis]|uniref:Uncharacterized protein n=1 Tax=Saccharothrix tamanrassetensis TaxID=1051531 RepID=A0A841CSM2_9PSEU|nr:hypothetical protein [Saccharothrix tamanrassetensis]MBB5958446.1 hypothetical protein [Saccharothrix tamanrassetensis]